MNEWMNGGHLTLDNGNNYKPVAWNNYSQVGVGVEVENLKLKLKLKLNSLARFSVCCSQFETPNSQLGANGNRIWKFEFSLLCNIKIKIK